jgi:catechol 2,3-dioxygenase-like lactoylglutathione lyase family enzyme
MAIILNHTIVPAHDNDAAARWFARIFGLRYDGPKGHFAPVKVNDSLTLLFDRNDSFGVGHYAFHVSDDEFDGIFGRVKAEGLVFGSAPGRFTDGQLNNWNGGRGVYFKSPDGHILELMTAPQ